MTDRDKIDKGFIPIYRTLFEHYKQGILTQKFLPASKIDSITEIQQQFQVSRETAKQVLKKLAKAGLIVQKPGKGSFVADLGPCGRNWGVIVPFFSAQTEELIHFLKCEADKNGRQLEYFIDYNNWEEEVRLVGTLINARFEAVLIIPTFDESKTSPFYQTLFAGGTTIVFLNHTMRYTSFPSAIQSYDLGIKRGMQYLLNHGEGCLAFVKNHLAQGRNMLQEVMESTFHGFIKRDEAACQAVIIDDISQLTRAIIEERRISGFFCCDDAEAVRVMGRLADWGLQVPQDIRLVSYGNTELARYFTPAITAIDPHYEQMAALAATIIGQGQNHTTDKNQQYVLQPELVIRHT